MSSFSSFPYPVAASSIDIHGERGEETSHVGKRKSHAIPIEPSTMDEQRENVYIPSTSDYDCESAFKRSRLIL